MQSKKKLASLLIVMLTTGLLTACTSNNPTTTNPNSNAAPQAAELDGFAMGTVISQKIYGDNGQDVADQTMKKITEMEKLLTFNSDVPEGDVYNINHNAGIKNVEVDPMTVKILKKAQEVAKLSGGAFDVTVGPVVKDWGIGTKPDYIPSQEELKGLLSFVNYQDLYVDDHSAGLKRAGQMIDLGGIAKGYAGDVAIDIYKQNGVKSGFISLGGNVVTLGTKPDGNPWSVGIRNPRQVGEQSGQIVGFIKVADKAVVTAGDDQRYFEKDGVRYHHILDPHTGYPAKSDLMSVTLVTDSSLDADAIDTAVFILGLEKGKKLLEEIGGIEAVFITTDKKVYVTDGLKGNFQFYDESKEYQYVE